MAQTICSLCKTNPAKYRCPTCHIQYCSLPCFKSEKHSHEEVQSSSETTADPPAQAHGQPADYSPTFDRVANDAVIKSLLRYKSLQIHLAVLVKLLVDSSFTKEPILENRREIVNMRLCELRIGGTEENELVEEFVQRVLTLLDT